jgi:serine/threonine protein kinase
LLGVFEALHAHQPPLLVGDLLTSDIWAAPDGNLSVAPFAVLRPIGQERATYQAPELADPQATPTAASDLYALGAVYYHLMTGWAPPAAALRSAGTPLNMPRELSAHISPMLERVLLRLLDMEPGERYQSVGELRHALELVHMIEDGMAAPPTAEQAAEASLSDTEAGAAVLASRQEFLPPSVAASAGAPPAAIVPATPTPGPPAPEAPPEDSTCLLIAAGLLLVVALALGAVLYYFFFGPGVEILFDRADELLPLA